MGQETHPMRVIVFDAWGRPWHRSAGFEPTLELIPSERSGDDVADCIGFPMPEEMEWDEEDEGV